MTENTVEPVEVVQKTIKDFSVTELEAACYRIIRAQNNLNAELRAIETELSGRQKNTKIEG